MPRWLVLTLTVLLVLAAAPTPARAAAPMPTISPLAWDVAPREVVTGPDGNLWFTNPFPGNTISRMTPAGDLTNFVDPQIHGAVGITAGPDGNLWVAMPYSDRLAAISLDGTVVMVVDDPDISFPYHLTTGADGNIWFSGLGAIGRVTPSGVVTLFPDPTARAYAITTGPDGNVWYADPHDDTIGRVTPAGVITHFTDPGIDFPIGITGGPDGNVWFTNGSPVSGADGTWIGRITPAGVVTTFHDDSLEYVYSITTGPDGALWFTNDGQSSFGHPFTGLDGIGRITTAGVVTTFADVGVSDPDAITTGPDGALWFANVGSRSLGRSTTTGTVTSFGGGASHVVAVTSGSDGRTWFGSRAGGGSIDDHLEERQLSFPPALGRGRTVADGGASGVWFADREESTIRRIEADGTVHVFTSPDIALPAGIAFGPDGNLWFTNRNAGSVGRITPAGVVTAFPDASISFAGGITVGHDGNLWFTSAGNGRIGRVTTAGVITTFPSLGVQGATGITAGPGGDVWFTNSVGNTIGRITPTGTMAFLPTAPATQPDAIAAGVDGSLWFTAADDTIGRLTPTGEVTVQKITFAHLEGGIAARPDGSIVFGTAAGLGVIDLGEPSAPTAVVATAGRGSVAVSWSAPTNPGGSAITGYQVTASPGGATCAWTTGPLGCTVGGLTDGTPYTFTVQATNGFGTGAASPPNAAAVPLDFTDLEPGAPFFADIGWLVGAGVATGYGDGSFRPATPVSRQAMAAFTYRSAGSPDGPDPMCSAPPFVDVPVSSPFCGEIAWVEVHGATGYADGTFRPATPVSRQAAAAFLYRLAGSPNGTAPACTEAPFTDVPVGAPFCGEIAWSAAVGLTTGDAGGTFRPTLPVSRQAMAAFLHRFDTLGLAVP